MSNPRPTIADVRILAAKYGFTFSGLGYTEELERYYRFNFTRPDDIKIVLAIRANKTPEDLEDELKKASDYFAEEICYAD